MFKLSNILHYLNLLLRFIDSETLAGEVYLLFLMSPLSPFSGTGISLVNLQAVGNQLPFYAE